MARNTTLSLLLDNLRAEARQSLNPAHNADVRQQQVKLLQKHQQRLWEDFRWPHLRVERQQPVQAGQRYYSPPEDMIIENIERVDIFRDGGWVPLRPQINTYDYSIWNSDLGQRSYPPLKWDLHSNNDTGDDEIELWPIPDTNATPSTMDGTLSFKGIRNLRPLVDNTDRCDLDDIMLVGFAAADILAASGAKDAQLKLDFANDRYRKLRSRLTVKKTFKVFQNTTDDCRPRRLMITDYKPPIIYPE